MLVACNLIALSFNVAMVLGLDLYLLCHPLVGHRLSRPWQGHQGGIAHIRAAQQLVQRILALYPLAQNTLGVLLWQHLRVDPYRLKSLLLTGYGGTLQFKCTPVCVAHHTQAAANFC